MRASSEFSLHAHQNFVEFAQERLVFCLFYQKLELFLVRPLRTKFGKILAVDQKDQRDRYVRGWTGSPKGNKNLFNMSQGRLFKKDCCTVLFTKAFY